jgi:hypothetical protein
MSKARAVARRRRLLLPLCALILCGAPAFWERAALAADGPSATLVALGHAVVPLNQPWKFHIGDDPRWASADFDDSDWETVDLTPIPGAHDNDVGLSGYVPGSNARGHRGYCGYAWYRMRISFAAAADFVVAMTGPPYVDSAYQAYFNGRLLGGSGTFNGTPPEVFGSQPRLFALPAGTREGVVAIRVWASPGRVAGAPDAGGIHIAPAVGEAGAINDRYLLQWRQTFLGYVVDVIPGMLLVLAALLAAILIPFDRSDRVYPWMMAALLLTAAIRFNQAIMFWSQIEDFEAYVLIRHVFLAPLCFGAWTMTWLTWFRIERPRWIPLAALVLTLAHVAAELLAGSWRPSAVPTAMTTALHEASAGLRLGFLALLALIAALGLLRERVRSALALLAMALVATGLFATELGNLHVKGIWFPYGVGVSRTEYSYVALVPVLVVLLLGRLMGFARASAPQRGLQLQARLAPLRPADRG